MGVALNLIVPRLCLLHGSGGRAEEECNMADIKLSDPESALWREVGSRGDAFRKATRDRAIEQVRLSGKMTEIVDYEDRMLESVDLAGPAE